MFAVVTFVRHYRTRTFAGIVAFLAGLASWAFQGFYAIDHLTASALGWLSLWTGTAAIAAILIVEQSYVEPVVLERIAARRASYWVVASGVIVAAVAVLCCLAAGALLDVESAHHAGGMFARNLFVFVVLASVAPALGLQRLGWLLPAAVMASSVLGAGPPVLHEWPYRATSASQVLLWGLVALGAFSAQRLRSLTRSA